MLLDLYGTPDDNSCRVHQAMQEWLEPASTSIQTTENIDLSQKTHAFANLYDVDLVSFTTFLNSSTKRTAASTSRSRGRVLLGSFGLVFKSFDKAEHSKEQSDSGCYVDR